MVSMCVSHLEAYPRHNLPQEDLLQEGWKGYGMSTGHMCEGDKWQRGPRTNMGDIQLKGQPSCLTVQLSKNVQLILY